MFIQSMLLVEFIRAGVKRRGVYVVTAEQLDSICGPRNEMTRSEWMKRVQTFAAEYGWEARFHSESAAVEFIPRTHP